MGTWTPTRAGRHSQWAAVTGTSVKTSQSTQAGADLLFGDSTGIPIPIIFGRAFLTGVPLWSGNIRNQVETTITQDIIAVDTSHGPVSGVTGSSSVDNVVGQIASLAVGFGRPSPVATQSAIVRMWVNGTLVFDQTSPGALTDNGQYKYRLYNGGETQLPDPAIVADKGSTAPAFRGMLYAVFDDFAFASSGGVFPTIVAEIVCSSQVVNPLQELASGTPITYASGKTLVDWANQKLYCFGFSVDQLDIYDLSSNNLYRSISSDGTHSFLSEHSPVLSIDGAYIYNQQGGSNTDPLQVFASLSGEFLSSIGNLNSATTPSATAFQLGNPLGVSPATYNVDEYVLDVSIFGSLIVARRNGGVLSYHDAYTLSGTLSELGSINYAVTNGVNKYLDASKMQGAPVIDTHNFSYGYVARNGTIYRYVLVDPTPKRSLVDAGFADGEVAVMMLPNKLGATSITNKGVSPFYCTVKFTDGVQSLLDLATHERVGWLVTGPADDPWVAAYIFNDTAGTAFLRKWDTVFTRKSYTPATSAQIAPDAVRDYFSQVFEVSLPYVGTLTNFPTLPIQMRPGSYWFSYASGKTLYLVNMATGELQTLDTTGFTWKNQANATVDFAVAVNQIFDPAKGTLTYMSGPSGSDPANFPGVATVINLTGLTITVGELLREYCLAAGYQDGDIDITDMPDDMTVIGSQLNTSTALMDLLSQVCELFRVDVVESEGKIKFKRKSRGADIVIDLDITDDDLAPLEQSGDNGTTLDSDRVLTNAVPTIVKLDYLDYSNLGAIGTQTARRMQFPFSTSPLAAEMDLGVPIYMTAAQALFRATFCLFDIWSGLTNNTFRLGQKGLGLEPGDFVRLTRTDGTVYLLKMDESTINKDLSVTGIGTTFGQYIDFPVPADMPGVDAQALVQLKKALFYLLDNFLLDPTTDPGDGTALPMNYGVDNAVSVKVKENGAYADVDALPPQSIFGLALNILGSPDRVFQTDTTNVITVEPSGDTSFITTLASDTDFLAGINALAIGDTGRWELVYFKNVTVNANGTLTLDTLLRGRRGTDVFVGTHQPYDKIVFLPVNPIVFPIALLDSDVTFKVANTNIPAQSPSLLNWNVNGGPLKPWAPGHIAAAFSGSDIVLTWTRRTRATDALHDGDADVSLGEGSEAYEVDVFDGAGAVVRTLKPLTSPTATYLAADQTTDGLTGLTAIHVAVYQLSETVGRGWAGNVTVDIS